MRCSLVLKALGFSFILAGFAFVGSPAEQREASAQMLAQAYDSEGITEASDIAAESLPLASGESGQRIPGVVQPVCRGEAQIPLNRCAGRWFGLTEQLHSEVLDDIEGELVGQPVMLERLAEAEASWVVFRDEHCDRIAKEVVGGSLHPMVINRCLARLTNERIAALHGWDELSVSRQEARRQMAAAYNTLLAAVYQTTPTPSNLPENEDPEMLQLQWNNYRNQHCQFEGLMASFFEPGSGEKEPMSMVQLRVHTVQLVERNCRARLAMERIAQLEDLASLSR